MMGMMFANPLLSSSEDVKDICHKCLSLFPATGLLQPMPTSTLRCTFHQSGLRTLDSTGFARVGTTCMLMSSIQ